MDENHNSIKRLKTIEKSLDKNEFITNHEYREKTGSLECEKFEDKRRKGLYKEALKGFKDSTQKSGLISINKGYYAHKFKVWNVLRKELYSTERKFIKFKIIKKTRSTVAKIVNKVIKNENKEDKKIKIKEK